LIWKIYISSCFTDPLNALRLTKSRRYLSRRLFNVCLPPLTAASLGIMQMLQKLVLNIWSLVIYSML